MKGKLLLALFFFMFMVSLSYSADIFTDDVCGNVSGWGSSLSVWFTRSIIAIMLALALYVVLYMLSKVFSLSKLDVWSRYELMQIVATFLIMMFIFAFVQAVLCNTSITYYLSYPGYTPPDGPGGSAPNMMNTAELYLVENLKWQTFSLSATTVMSNLYNIFANLKLSAKAGIPMVGAVQFKDLKPLDGLNTLDFATSTVQSGIMASIGTTLAQLAFLTYIRTIVLGTLLPLGILLRCFKPTRQFGGGLIGLAIGLGFFYPFMLSINHMMVYSVTSGGSGLSVSEWIEDSVESSLYAFKLGGTNFVDLVAHPINNILETYEAHADPTASVFEVTGLTVKDEVVENLTLSASAIYWVMAKFLFMSFLVSLLLPLLDFIIIATGVRELSRFFGTEINIKNLTRML